MYAIIILFKKIQLMQLPKHFFVGKTSVTLDLNINSPKNNYVFLMIKIIIVSLLTLLITQWLGKLMNLIF